LEEHVLEWNEFLQIQKQQEQQRMKILAELRREPAFEELQAYLQRLKQGSDKIDTDGSAIWDVDTFTEDVQRFAELCGSQRSKYYDNPLEGLHYPNTFLGQWAQSYPELPRPLWLDDFKWQCPPVGRKKL
jgi:hypothetical protein